MPLKFAYFLPLIYAILGSLLWYDYGVNTLELILWIVGQSLLLLMYVWLIKGGSTGLLMQLHIVVTAIGMAMLFFVLLPWRPEQSSSQGVLIELVVMGVGTFLCAFGVNTLLYLIGRKLLFMYRVSRRNRLKAKADNTSAISE